MEADETIAGVEDYFDILGEEEWRRLDADLPGRVSLEVHRRFLTRFITPGMRVLEIGAGAGRFTIELARLGCRVVVSDISNVQLELNRAHLEEAGLATHVEAWQRLDVRDQSAIAAGSFDAVVAYGGPLSYAFGDAQAALSECLRVVTPSGPIVASVMSLPGSARFFLASFPSTIEAVGLKTFDRFLQVGDQRMIGAAGAHPCRMFAAAEIHQMVHAVGARLLGSSASNWLSMGSAVTLEALSRDTEGWERFLAWEEAFCAQPGAVDGGTHLLFALSRDRSAENR